ncbi:hypothetical protein [Candidatus Methylacidiphilum fumarolicum]|uniref:hypothetical protein n=1 Tax=Candidatus Methylacidiphilum fumarolicum TaxID=591154 RepID=UPI0002E208F0|nr:hypothetical protein [Candidatus Methylacidiphilum fumarolicum]
MSIFWPERRGIRPRGSFLNKYCQPCFLVATESLQGIKLQTRVNDVASHPLLSLGMRALNVALLFLLKT